MNPFPQRKKKETDPFTFSFRLKQTKVVAQKNVTNKLNQYYHVPSRTVKVNNVGPLLPSDLDLFNSLQYQPTQIQYSAYHDCLLDFLLSPLHSTSYHI